MRPCDHGRTVPLFGDLAYPHPTTISSGLSPWYCAESLNCEIMAEAVLPTPSVGDKPHHAVDSFKFPQREYGKKTVVKRLSGLGDGPGFTTLKIVMYA